MQVTLIHRARYPVVGYGGTERLVWWIAKGLSKKGIKVTLLGEPGSHCPFAEVNTSVDWKNPLPPSGTTITHYFNTPPTAPPTPYLVTIGGNGKAQERFDKNTVFVSENHAARHGSRSFVHNGVDPEEYIFSTVKDRSLLFLAKASWRVKNVKGAIRIARASGRPLDVVGGHRKFFKTWRGTNWRGDLGGREKSEIISRSAALLFPVLWHEPFGLAVVESLLSGTPVLATPFGSLPELINSEVGAICKTEQEFVEALGDLSSYKPERCRDWAMAHFHYQGMVEKYLTLYEKILSGKNLNSEYPSASEGGGSLMPIRSLNA